MPSSHGLTTRADQARCQCCTPNSRSGVGSAAIRPARIAAQIGGYSHRARAGASRWAWSDHGRANPVRCGRL